MNVFLFHPEHAFDVTTELPPHHEALTQDLELETVLTATAAGDPFIHDVAARVVLSSLTGVDEITYRQRVLADCLANPSIIREMYELVVEALESERKADTWWLFRDSPEAVLSRSVKVLELLAGFLRRLRVLAETYAADFGSDGFRRFIAMLSAELDDAYLADVGRYLDELKLRHGVSMSAQLSVGLKATRFVMHRPPQPRWLDRFINRRGPELSFQIPDHDRSAHTAALADNGVQCSDGDGINLWMRVADERGALMSLAAAGIGAAPGTPFLVRHADDHLRITTGLIKDHDIERVADTLANAAGHVTRHRAGR